MPLPRRSLSDGARTCIVGKLASMWTKTYSEGSKTLLEFHVQDQTGSIAGIAWDDSCPVFAPVLKTGRTYKFFNVLITRQQRNNQLEMKLYPDTRVEAHSAIEVEATTIANLEEGYATVRGIIASRASTSETTKKEEAFRVDFVDKTGNILVYLTREAIRADIAENDIVELGGYFTGEQKEPSFQAYTAQKVDDPELLSYWGKEQEAPNFKRAKLDAVSLDKLEGLRSLEKGARGEFKGVVRTQGLVPQTLTGGRVKYTMSIVDDSNVAVDVGVFCDASVPSVVEIGDVVKMKGTVSAYNTKSITTNAVDKVDDEALRAWWAENSSVAFEELSYDSRGI